MCRTPSPRQAFSSGHALHRDWAQDICPQHGMCDIRVPSAVLHAEGRYGSYTFYEMGYQSLFIEGLWVCR